MIRYHGLPITPNEAAMSVCKLFGHAFVSYSCLDQLDVALQWCRGIGIDNGAFSAWQKSRSFDFDGFMHFAKHHYRHPSVNMIIAPDIIDGTEDENNEMLYRAMGIIPLAPWVPVWHMHESLERLHNLCSGFRAVAIGSSGQYAELQTDIWWQRITEAMKYCCDSEGYPLCDLHGLRQMDPTIFSHVPYASVDSTGVGQNIGIDKKWPGPYAPKSKWVRAVVLADRSESHACATRWTGSRGVEKNMELFG